MASIWLFSLLLVIVLIRQCTSTARSFATETDTAMKPPSPSGEVSRTVTGTVTGTGTGTRPSPRSSLGGPVLDALSNPVVRKSLLRTVKHFMHYHLHFYSIESLTVTSAGILYSERANNTDTLYQQSITTCVRPDYLPRRLFPNQVSWKNPKKDKESNNSNSNSTNSNSTTSNGSSFSSEPNDSKDTKRQEIVHPYLAFAMLLPDHPVSQDLLVSLTTVAPLFPAVTVVVGNAYEFHDMCGQYQLRTFPKLLMFKDGFLLGRFEKNPKDVGSLAQQFALWTKSLPQALPIPPSMEPRLVRFRNRLLENENGAVGPLGRWVSRLTQAVAARIRVPEGVKVAYNGLQNRAEIRALRHLAHVFVQQPMEPFVGTTEYPAEYDVAAYLFCVCYVALRLVAWCVVRSRRAQ